MTAAYNDLLSYSNIKADYKTKQQKRLMQNKATGLGLNCSHSAQSSRILKTFFDLSRASLFCSRLSQFHLANDK